MHAPTSASDTVPKTDYGLSGISPSLAPDLNEARVVPRDVQLQNSPAAALLPQFSALEHGHTHSSDAIYGQQINSQTSGPRNADVIDPFSGFDIPFWFEQDQYWDVFQNFE
jgi:hypothetical protein